MLLTAPRATVTVQNDPLAGEATRWHLHIRHHDTQGLPVPSKYLQHFPAPLLEDLIHNRWLPIVGAGFSRNAVVPPGRKMPLWDDLGKQLHGDLPDYSYTSALDVISAYCHHYSRARLVERLHSLLLIDEARPGRAHRSFCNLPFDYVCTTNFDFLLEKQYLSADRPCTPILSEEQLAVNLGGATKDVAPRTVLLKLHGDLNHPASLVATEDDYDGFVAQRPLFATHVGNLLIGRTAVLIGYSLDDSDLRQIWRIVASRLGALRRPAYAIMVAPEPAVVARYERRGVRVINVPGRPENYGRILADIFDELRVHWLGNALPTSAVVREEALQELSLPSIARTRICFLSAPRSSVAYLREVLAPEISKAGFAPTTVQDVASSGGNLTAKVEALLGRAAIAIIAAGSDWTEYELRAALATLGASRVLVLRRAHDPGTSAITSEIELQNVAYYEDDILDDPSSLVAAVQSWLAARARELRDHVLDEPNRLFQMREYRAALILAVGGVEVLLRERLQRQEHDIDARFTLGRLLDAAIRRQLIGEPDADALRQVLRIRNEAVHTGRVVHQGEARRALDLLKRLAQQ